MVSVVQLHPQGAAAALEALAEGLAGEERAMRGGSWLCSENYCTNFRPAARSHATPDSGLNNVGFRCVRAP